MYVNQMVKNQIEVFVTVTPLVKPSRRMESAVVVLVNVALVENNVRIG